MTKALVVFVVSLLAAIFTTHISDGFSSQRMSSGPRPRPFFFSDNASSALTGLVDMWKGNNASPIVLRSKSDVALAFYYAAWNREARMARRPFLRVAHAFKNHPERISFTAINCWTGECRRSFQMFTFPVIVAYTRHLAVLYQGRMDTGSIYRWVKRLLNPVTHLRSEEEILDFTLSTHYTAIGYFPFTDAKEMPGYGSFVAASVITAYGLPSDSNLAFGVVINATVARTAGLVLRGTIRFQSVSEPGVIIAPNLTAEKLVEKIQSERKSEAALRYLNLNKNVEVMSDQFSELLNRTAVMMLVTNVDNFYPGQSDLTLFKEAALDYWACNPRLTGATKERLAEIHQERSEALERDKKNCESVAAKYVRLNGCCESLAETTDLHLLCEHKDPDRPVEWECESEEALKEETCKKSVSNIATSPRHSVAIHSQHCFELSQHFNAVGIVDDCCGLGYGNRVSPREKRGVILKRGIQLKRLDDSCRRYALSQKGPRIPDVPYIGDPLNSLPAFGCARNNSVEWAVADYRYWKPMLRKWGMAHRPLPQIIAIDTARELFSVMEGPMSRDNLQTFVSDYQRDFATDYLLSEEDTESPFHVPEIPKHCDGQVELIPLTQRSFEELIARRPEGSGDSVVLFSGGAWHAPSTSVIHVTLSAASYFCGYERLIRFYILDNSRNEAPFQYHIERLPSLVFFAGRDPDLSWQWPSELPFSVPNIIAWVTSRASRTLRWTVALSSCNKPCLQKNRQLLVRRERQLRSEVARLRAAVTKAYVPKLRELYTRRRALLHNSLKLRRAVESLLESPDNVPPLFPTSQLPLNHST